MSQKQKRKVEVSIDLVAGLDTATRAKLKVYKGTVEVRVAKCTVESILPEVDASKVEAAAIPIVTAAQQVFKGRVRELLVPVDKARQDGNGAALKKSTATLLSEMSKVVKGCHVAVEGAMQDEWKKIKSKQDEAEAKLKATPKLSTWSQLKVVLKAIKAGLAAKGVAEVAERLILSVKETVDLIRNARDQHQVDSEKMSRTDAVKRLTTVARGLSAQAKGDLAELRKHLVPLCANLSGIVAIYATIDDTACKLYVGLEKVKEKLEQAVSVIKKILPPLETFAKAGLSLFEQMLPKILDGSAKPETVLQALPPLPKPSLETIFSNLNAAQVLLVQLAKAR